MNEHINTIANDKQNNPSLHENTPNNHQKTVQRANPGDFTLGELHTLMLSKNTCIASLEKQLNFRKDQLKMLVGACNLSSQDLMYPPSNIPLNVPLKNLVSNKRLEDYTLTELLTYFTKEPEGLKKEYTANGLGISFGYSGAQLSKVLGKCDLDFDDLYNYAIDAVPLRTKDLHTPLKYLFSNKPLEDYTLKEIRDRMIPHDKPTRLALRLGYYQKQLNALLQRCGWTFADLTNPPSDRNLDLPIKSFLKKPVLDYTFPELQSFLKPGDDARLFAPRMGCSEEKFLKLLEPYQLTCADLTKPLASAELIGVPLKKFDRHPKLQKIKKSKDNKMKGKAQECSAQKKIKLSTPIKPLSQANNQNDTPMLPPLQSNTFSQLNLQHESTMLPPVLHLEQPVHVNNHYNSMLLEPMLDQTLNIEINLQTLDLPRFRTSDNTLEYGFLAFDKLLPANFSSNFDPTDIDFMDFNVSNPINSFEALLAEVPSSNDCLVFPSYADLPSCIKRITETNLTFYSESIEAKKSHPAHQSTQISTLTDTHSGLLPKISPVYSGLFHSRLTTSASQPTGEEQPDQEQPDQEQPAFSTNLT